MSINAEFMEKLSNKYKGIKEGEEAWKQEKAKINEILSKMAEDINDRYSIESPINIGGAGIVIKVIDKNLNVPQALKCARPVAGKESLLTRIISSEISRLRESTHPNIVSIFYKGEVVTDNQTWPYYIMEYIEGALDAFDYIEMHKPNYTWIIKLIQQCIEGLIFLHFKETIHGDIKLENLLVAPNGKAKISDLGSARLLTPIPSEDCTTITFTRAYADPELRLLLSEAYSDPNRVSAKVERARLKKVFDLYALGKNILRILKKYDISDHDHIPIYHSRYLELMACRMLNGKNEDDECALNLPKSAFNEIKYSSAEEVLLDIKKLTGEYSLHEAIPELDHHFPRTIQISNISSISFPKRVANILSSPLIRRLAGISQLGLIVQIYPTATHSRLEHILGTFANVVRYCDALWNDPINPLFKQIISEHDIKLVLVAALCHDIGQYPLAHDLEEAENKLFSHKEIGNKLLTDSKNNGSLKNVMQTDWGITPEDVSALLSTDPADLNAPLKKRLLHTLIDGPIDADKMDYLIRDSNNLNVPYGNCIDFERLLRCLTIAFKQQGANTFITLGIHEKGKIPAEALAFARYAMFGSVYWHHTSRGAKSMLHRAVWEALPKTDRRSSEYQLLKEQFFDEVLQESGIVDRKNIQATLFKEKSLIKKTPQLNIADYEMLSWIYQKSSNSGKKLLEMICERDIFKRLLVLSESKNHPLWEKLTDLRKNYTWQVLLEFQNKVQANIVKIIDSIEDEKRRTTSILSKDITDEIVGRNDKREILFLVDIPTERKGSSIELYYLPEARICGPLPSTGGNIQMEDSLIWTDLSKNFLKSVGKIRVFCHPDIIETCTAGLTRSDIESALEEACRNVTT
jgi:HD superfamily phosphohydrolase